MTGSMRFGLRAALALCLWLLSGAAATAAAPATAPASGPVTFTVNSLNDVIADFSADPGFTVCHTNPTNHTCTLRAAIMNANRHAGGTTINLPAGRYVTTAGPTGPDDDASGDLTISNSVTIAGAGAASTIVDGGQLDRVFLIENGGTVTMTGLTIENGAQADGAGVYNFGSQLILANSVISGSSATAVGGGLINDSGGAVTLTNDTIQGNRAGQSGGGLYNLATMAVNNSTIAYNRSAQVGGGLTTQAGALTVFNSTISNNSAVQMGGGYYDHGGSNRFFQTTIAGNLADSSGPGADDGGGLYNAASSASLQMQNSLLQFNSAGELSNDCAGNPLTSKDYNFIEVGCSVTGTTTNNVSGFDAKLASLADNGGPTLTRALLPGSRALDRIPPGLCEDPFGTAPVPDQRGVARPVGPLCDMGAYEGALPTPLLGRNLVANGDAEASAGSPNGAHVGVAGWPATQGQFTVVTYNATGGFPSVPTDTVPANHGLNFFAGGNAAASLGQQVIDVTAISPTVDAGGVQFRFSADLGGFFTQGDNASVSLAFANGHAHNLALYELGPVTAAQRGNKTGLLPRSLAGGVPAGTRFVFVTLVLTRAPGPGTYDDGYADNISLVLTDALFLPLVQR